MIGADDALQLFGGRAGAAVDGGTSLAAPASTGASNVASDASATNMSAPEGPSILHKDMTPDQALAAMGVSPATIAQMGGVTDKPQSSGSSVGADAAKSLGAGIVTGVENAPMMVGQADNLLFRYGLVEPGIAIRRMLGNADEKKIAALRNIQLFPNNPEQAGATLAGAGLSAAGYDVRPEDVKKASENVPTIGQMIHTPETTAGEYANTIGQFVGGARTMGVKPGALPDGAAPLTTMQKAGAEIKTAAPVIAGAIGSETGGQIFKGTDLETPARLIGAVVGGGAYSLGGSGMKAAKTGVSHLADQAGVGAKQEIIPAQNGNPSLEATQAQQRMAGQKIIEAARNPDRLQQTLGQFDQRFENQGQVPQGIAQGGVTTAMQSAGPAEALQPGQIIKGSKPTLAEMTLDPGVAQWQDALRSKNRDAFITRTSDQNAARNSSISAVGGKGSPEAVGQFFGDQLKSIDNDSQAAIDAAQANIAGHTDAIGGFEKPSQYGQAIRDQIATDTAESKARLSGLWNVLEHYNDVRINGNRAVGAVRDILGGIDEGAGQSLSPRESAIYNAVSNWTDHPSFGRLKTLRSEITDAQREMRVQYGTESQPMRRIGMMKQAVDQTINDAVTGISHVENHAIEAGLLAPENSLLSKMQQHVERFYADRKANAVTGTGTSAYASPVGYAATDRSSSIPVVGRAGSDSQFGPRGPARDQSISSAGRVAPPSFDKKGQKAYEAARLDTVRHKQTFKTGVVGGVMKEGRQGVQYEVPDSAVASKFFHSKASSPESIAAYSKAVGDKAEALSLLKEYAASDLRSKAINPDGTINPKAFSRWVKAHSNAIEAFPELKSSLSNIKSAQEFFVDKLAERKAALDDFNKSRAATFVNADPLVAVRKAFRSDNSTAAFADLVKRVRGDKAATEGLKRAAADYLLQEVRGAEKGDEVSLDLRDPKAFRKFVDKHNGALKILFGGQGINNLERVVSDMRRSSIVTKGAKLPGQSNTTQDALAVAKQSSGKSILGKIAHEVASHAITGGAVLGELAGGHPLIGAAIAIGGKMLGTLRSAGIDTIEKLQLEAALNPQLANELVKKASADKLPVPVQNRIGSIILKMIPIAASHRITQENEDNGAKQ